MSNFNRSDGSPFHKSPKRFPAGLPFHRGPTVFVFFTHEGGRAREWKSFIQKVLPHHSGESLIRGRKEYWYLEKDIGLLEGPKSVSKDGKMENDAPLQKESPAENAAAVTLSLAELMSRPQEEESDSEEGARLPPGPEYTDFL